MGKHFKQEVVEKEKPYKEKFQDIRTGIEAMAESCEYYKARIKKLEADVARLIKEKEELELNLAVMTNLYEHGSESLQRSEARSDEIIERKNEEIKMAKEAIYLAAMREVSLR